MGESERASTQGDPRPACSAVPVPTRALRHPDPVPARPESPEA